MASLAELYGERFTITDIMLRLLNQLKKFSDHLYAGAFNDYELDIFPGYYQRVFERNEKVIGS
jgi:octanoyl-[GcvH]:protein N-octanoyltransferase